MNSDEPKLKRLFGSEGTMGLFVALYLILLTFFILLNAMSEHAASRAVAAMESVNVTFNISRQLKNNPTIDPSAVEIASKDKVLQNVHRAFLSEMGLKGRFGTEGGNTFEVQFPAENLFQQGSFSVRSDMTYFLDQLLNTVQATPAGNKQQLAILFGSGVGTVDREMTRGQEMAVRRAGSIGRYLRRKGIADGIFTTGFTAVPEGEVLAVFWSAPTNMSGDAS